MMRFKRALSLAVIGLALVLGGHAAVSAAPLFEAREQIANVASRGHHSQRHRGHHVYKKHHARRHYNRHYKRRHGFYQHFGYGFSFPGHRPYYSHHYRYPRWRR